MTDANSTIRVAGQLTPLQRELLELRAIVAHLPTDRNGRPVPPGGPIVCPRGHPIELAPPQRSVACLHPACRTRSGGHQHMGHYSLSDCEVRQP